MRRWKIAAAVLLLAMLPAARPVSAAGDLSWSSRAYGRGPYLPGTYAGNTTTCAGEDTVVEVTGSGTLGAGVSSSFTSPWGDCANPRAVWVQAGLTKGNTRAGQLEITSTTTADSGYALDTGTPLRATSVNGTTALCMFVEPDEGEFTGDTYEPPVWTFTVTNRGSKAAPVWVSAGDENDWPVNFYRECATADADRDGWSDSVEHTMELNSGWNDSLPGMDAGTGYLNVTPATATASDEFDAVPTDLDDDGAVTDTDRATVAAHVGEGDGTSLASWGVAPGSCCGHRWARYDLDGDGWVTTADVALVR